jgi:4-amino-4-deoxy-L-arabinose transferase-like glycosyltransferase
MPSLHRLIDRLARNPADILWVFAAYYIVQLAVRLLLPHGLRIDEAQQVLLSQWFAAGYDAQPPLYNWLQQVLFAITGDYLVGLAALKSVMLLAVVSSYYALARLLVRQPALATVATLGFFFIPQMFWQAQRDLTHTTATMLMVNLILIAAVITLRKPSMRNYVLLGSAAGLGMLTKYNFVLVLPSLLLACMLQPAGLKRVFDPKILIAMAVAGLIVLPHALWFLNNMGVASSVTAARMAEDATDTNRLHQIILGLGELIQMTIVLAAPAVLVISLPFGRAALAAWRARSSESHFIGTFLAGILLILALMIVVITFTTFRDRWLLPLLQVLPLYVVLKLDAHGVDAEAGLRRLLPIALVAIGLIPIAMTIAGYAGRPSHYHQPYAAFRTVFTEQEALVPSLIVAPNWHSAGNLKMQWPNTAVMTVQFPNLKAPYDWSRDKPVALMWRGDGTTVPPSLQKWAQDNLGKTAATTETRTVSLPFTGKAQTPAPDFHYVLISP